MFSDQVGDEIDAVKKEENGTKPLKEIEQITRNPESTKKSIFHTNKSLEAKMGM